MMRRSRFIPFCDDRALRVRSLLLPFALHADPAAGEGGSSSEGGDPAPKEKTYTEADIAGLKAKNAELIERAKKLSARAAVIGERTPEEVQADLELAAKFKEDKAKAEGDFSALKAQLLQQHATEKEKLSGRVSKIEGKLYDVLAKREAEAAIVAAGGNPKVLLPHILPFVKVTEQDDDFTAQVVDAKGSPRIADSQGSAMTIAQLVETFKADETFGIAFSAGGVSGSGARNEGGGGGGKGGLVLIPKDADVATYRRLKADAEKRGVPYQVAS